LFAIAIQNVSHKRTQIKKLIP